MGQREVCFSMTLQGTKHYLIVSQIPKQSKVKFYRPIHMSIDFCVAKGRIKNVTHNESKESNWSKKWPTA